MAYFSFTRAILEGRPIKVFNHGNMQRDFTYIDDVVEAVVRLLPMPPSAADPASVTLHPGSSYTPFRLFNIGNHSPVTLTDFIATLEAVIGSKAIVQLEPMQAGDVLATFADVDDLARMVDFRPDTPLRDGLERFHDWYRGYHAAR